MGAKTPKTSDRRIQKTRGALREALIALITERGWDGFSVQDLCDRADICRSTFYVHFADKDDVLTGSFEEFRQVVREQIALKKTPVKPFAFAEAIIEHAYEHKKAFRALLGKGTGQTVLMRFRDLVVDLVGDDLTDLRASKHRKGAAISFLAGGFLELLTYGLESGPISDPQELEQLFQEMALPVLEVLKRP